jgi:hypothetical protein
VPLIDFRREIASACRLLETLIRRMGEAFWKDEVALLGIHDSSVEL